MRDQRPETTRSQPRNAVVIGGGYAGVMAANRLTQGENVTVTLINPRPTFVERIRLHQLVGGSHSATHDLRDVLAERVHLVVDTATRIDAATRSIELAGGGSLAYDYLIYAVGSHSAASDVPGAEHTYPIGTLEEAQRLQAALTELPDHAPVTVVGGGLTGIETAAELAESGRQVRLLTGGVLAATLHERGRRSAAQRLAALGVELLDGVPSRVRAVEPDAVLLAAGRRLDSALTIWTAGFSVPALARDSGLSTDALGRLRTDESWVSLDDERIVATGDAAAPSDLPARMSCQAAVQVGPQAAETVLALIAGKQPDRLSLAFVSQCVSLGRRDGLLQLTHLNDTARRTYLAGRPGAAIKELICSGIIWQLKLEARFPGRVTMRLTDPARRRRLAAAGASVPPVAGAPAARVTAEEAR
ncbi:NAD(P)/FAD-dependent oxidoreductase [Ruania zhangjianzhongii]|uniref:NAD(P)/FAD-dependent oxidoreductase n=1 Tax=Ruania zhangjianzhongii TaxID=2603206 RepID=UPI0011CB6924|nr:FAD-dependent oxidoreductase [Ruania zhangjianzhongii]